MRRLFASLAVFFGVVMLTTSQDLQLCRLYGDPHIEMFHDTTGYTRSYKDCLDPGTFSILASPLVHVLMDVSNYWIIELTFLFRRQQGTPNFCTLTTYNLEIEGVERCQSGGVDVTRDTYFGYSIITVTYPNAQFTAIIMLYTHDWGVQHYNIEIYMPSTAIVGATGVCAVDGCTGRSVGKRSVRSTQNAFNNTTNLTNETARQICDTFIDNYLRTLARTPSQRSVHYNGTIENLRKSCTFDAAKFGPYAAPSILEVLMLEEITVGVTNFMNVPSTIQRNSQVSLANLARVVNDTMLQVTEILNQTTTQVTYLSVFPTSSDAPPSSIVPTTSDAPPSSIVPTTSAAPISSIASALPITFKFGLCGVLWLVFISTI